MKHITLALNTIITIILVVVFFLSFILITYSHFNIDIAQAWSFISAISGAIATLGAAYIGANLFNDWREIHEANYISTLCDSTSEVINEIYRCFINVDVKLLIAEKIRGTFPVSLLNENQRGEIYKHIPEIEELSIQILNEIKFLELKIVNLLAATKEDYTDIQKDYNRLKDLTEAEIGKILKPIGVYEKYGKISQARKSIDLIFNELKSFQSNIAQKFAGLNSYKD